MDSTEKVTCPECLGSGEVMWHAEDCHSDLCSLAGGYHDCLGMIVPCPTCHGSGVTKGEE